MSSPSPQPSPARGEGVDGIEGDSPLPFRERGRGRGEVKPTRHQLQKRAKSMRSAPTDAERRLWTILRGKRLSGYKFRRQQPIDYYIADFVCLAHRLIVEADGGQHCSQVDAVREAYLKTQGFRILRFWNNEILINEEGVTRTILRALEDPSPRPSPARGEGVGVSNA